MKNYEDFDAFATEKAMEIDSNFNYENEEEILAEICQSYGFPSPIDDDFEF